MNEDKKEIIKKKRKLITDWLKKYVITDQPIQGNHHYHNIFKSKASRNQLGKVRHARFFPDMHFSKNDRESW